MPEGTVWEKGVEGRSGGISGVLQLDHFVHHPNVLG